MKITVYGIDTIRDMFTAHSCIDDYIKSGHVQQKERVCKHNRVVYSPHNARRIYVWGDIKHVHVEFEQWSDFHARKATINDQ